MSESNCGSDLQRLAVQVTNFDYNIVFSESARKRFRSDQHIKELYESKIAAVFDASTQVPSDQTVRISQNEGIWNGIEASMREPMTDWTTSILQ